MVVFGDCWSFVVCCVMVVVLFVRCALFAVRCSSLCVAKRALGDVRCSLCVVFVNC